MTLSQVPRELAERLVPHPQTCTEQYCTCTGWLIENRFRVEAVIREAMQKAQPQWISVEERLPDEWTRKDKNPATDERAALPVGERTTRNSEVLADFVKYCREHPEQRFWQALRNWSEYPFLLVSDGMDDSAFPATYMIDTFPFEGRRHEFKK
jgi:hypothetical protein